ncbi:hypothetical protein [Oscillibacter sp.]|uniref:hypothetical protein n=1 Tax=Oscillibacter sp. TaxID=1945593 RepID=UPI00263119CE|nr:hypothetical protein [Oscillibacter sp.]MDD3346504.1 hypothetical protein [Oscillibacter sp.]
MNNEELLPAIREGRTWLRRFQRRQYRDAFLAYTERFGPLYASAVTQRGAAALAAALLDEMEKGWAQRRFWNRGAAQAEEKQMLVMYLTPMLLGLSAPGCADLAQSLHDGWIARRPKDEYQLATYAEIQSGFRNAILGIDIRS